MKVGFPHVKPISGDRAVFRLLVYRITPDSLRILWPKRDRALFNLLDYCDRALQGRHLR
jgi:hypothetical protein